MKIVLIERWLCKKSGSVREVVPYEVILYAKVPYENRFCEKSNSVYKVVI